MSDAKKQAMQLAIQSALTGIRQGEGGPFGACVTQQGKVIAVAHNTVLKDNDPTCHSEMNAIRQACKKLETYTLEGCEIFSTAEPCPMCLAAIYWARIDRIYMGVDKSVAARFGFDDDKFYQQIQAHYDQREIPTEFGIMFAECEKVFQHWQDLEGVLY